MKLLLGMYYRSCYHSVVAAAVSLVSVVSVEVAVSLVLVSGVVLSADVIAVVSGRGSTVGTSGAGDETVGGCGAICEKVSPIFCPIVSFCSSKRHTASFVIISIEEQVPHCGVMRRQTLSLPVLTLN